MNHLATIDRDIENKISHEETVRKVYLSYPTFAFVGKEDLKYEIFNEISNFFKVPFTSIQATGSGQIGRSLHKKRDFQDKKSDLDIAIIDSSLFIEYMEIVSKETNGYREISKFPMDTEQGGTVKDKYLSYLSKGIFRPDLMPSCTKRAEIRSFFGKLSTKHSSLFKSIDAGIYLSECFFEKKQRTAIELHVKNKETTI
ncbi:TPA: hypothetical protein P0E35_005052 [Vibrio harveyi]|nr:hypothetical protein [Vibrio harveyi]